MKLTDILFSIYDRKRIPLFEEYVNRDREYTYHSHDDQERVIASYRTATSRFTEDAKEQVLTAPQLEHALRFLKVKPGAPELYVYAQLLPLMTFALTTELFHNVYFEDEIAKATAKLTLLFGDIKKALTYLKKYQETYPKSEKPISEACEFNLPDKKWDIAFWRELAEHYMPNTVFSRLLSQAGKIETYVKKNHEQIRAEIQKSVVENYRRYLAAEYDKLAHRDETEEAYLEKTMRHDKTKSMLNKNIKSGLYAWAREHLSFPITGKLDEKQSAQMKILMTEKIYAEKSAEIETLVTESHKRKLLNEFKKKKVNKDKESYLDERMSKDAKIIATNVKTACEKIFSLKTDLKTLSSYAEKICYSEAELAPDWAKLFFEHGITEHGFETYIKLIPQDNSENIPDVFIDGAELKHEGFYIKKLSSHDPRCAIMGKLTSCCQFISGPGSDYVEHAIESEYAGVYVICKRQGSTPSDEDLIISQAWAWRGKTNRIVFDSIETHTNFYEKFKNVIFDLFTALAHTLVTKFSVPEVTVGVARNCQTPASFKCIETTQPEEPIDYRDYNYNDRRDSQEQCVLASRAISLFSADARSVISRDSKEYVEIIKNYTLLNVIQNNNLSALKKLLKSGIPFVATKKDHSGSTTSPFLLAAKYADLEMLKYLLENEKVIADSKAAWQLDILRYAAEGKDPKILHFLLEKKLGLNIDTHRGHTDQYQLGSALSNAFNNNKVESAQVLIEYKAKFDNFSREILKDLILYNRFGMVKLLFENGATCKYSDIAHNLNLGVERGHTRLVTYLCEKFPEAKIQLLILAIQSENFSEIKKLVEAGLDINSIPSLAYAAQTNNQDIFDYLISKGATINELPEETTLNVAVKSNNMHMVKTLIEMKAACSNTSMIPAIKCGNTAMIQYFADQKAIFSEKEIKEAASCNHLPIFQLLMRNSDIPPYRAYDFIPKILESAIENQNLDMVRCITESPKPIDSTILNNALIKATQTSTLPIIKLLVEKKACVGPTLGKAAAQGCHGELEIFQFLIENKANINKTYCDNTPLSWAIINNREDVAKLLFENGGQLREKIGYEFERAINRNNKNLINLLLTMKLDINSIISYDGKTALGIACGNDNIDMILHLIKHKADVNSGDESNKPIQIAVKNKNLAFVKVLIENAADMDMSHYAREKSPLELAAAPSRRYKPHSTAMYDFLLSKVQGIAAYDTPVVFFKNSNALEKHEAELRSRITTDDMKLIVNFLNDLDSKNKAWVLKENKSKGDSEQETAPQANIYYLFKDKDGKLVESYVGIDELRSSISEEMGLTFRTAGMPEKLIRLLKADIQRYTPYSSTTQLVNPYLLLELRDAAKQHEGLAKQWMYNIKKH